jgi:hypothetical protein
MSSSTKREVSHDPREIEPSQRRFYKIESLSSSMNRFNMVPSEGHLKAAKRIVSFLKTFPKGRVIIDTS